MSWSLAYVVRNLRRRRTRTAVGALGVFLTIALLTAIQLGLDSVATSYIDLVSLQAGKADLLISKAGSDIFNPTPFESAAVTARLQTNSALLGLSPRWLGVVQVRRGSQEHYALLLGLDLPKERELGIAGLTPEPNLSPDTCAVSEELAAKLGARSGTNLWVSPASGGPETVLRLSATLRRQLVLPQQVRHYVVVNAAAARSVLGVGEQVHLLAGAFRNANSYYDARDLRASVLRLKAAGEQLSTALGLGYQTQLPKAAAITAFQDFTSPLRAVFGVFGLLALAITGLLVYSLIAVAVEERVREYAILRTLGAKGRDLFGLVLTESVLLCVVGVAPGVLAGLLLAQVVVKLVGLALRADGAAPTLTVSPATLWLTVAAGGILAIGSALLPAIQATRRRIVAALEPLRGGELSARRPRDHRAHRGLIAAGGVLSALSVVVFFVLPTAFLSGNPSLIGTVVLCLLLSILLGFTLVAVGLSPWLERAVLLAIGRAIGPAAELAGRNLQRHQRRNTTTALLFTLSVALVLFVASLVALFSRTSLAMVEQVHGADIRIHSPLAGADSLRADLGRLDGVEAVAEVRFLRSRSESGIAYDVVASDVVGLKHVWVVPFGADTNLGRVMYASRIVSQAGRPESIAELASRAVVPDAKDPPTQPAPPIILSQAVAGFLELGVGDPVQMTFQLGPERSEARFRVAGVYRAVPGLENFRGRVARAVGAGVLLSRENFRAMTRAAPAEAVQAFYFVKAKGSDAAHKALAQRIRDELDLRYRFGVQCTAEQRENARILYWATQVFFGLLLGVAVVIALFALIASMASAVIERRWEIGVLKALGLRRRHLFRMFLGEAIALTLAAGLAGGAIGFTLAYLFVVQATVLMEVATVFTMPYLTFVATVLVSLLAGALAAHVPTRDLLRRPAADILRLET